MKVAALKVLVASLMASHHYPTPIDRVSANHYRVTSSVLETNDCTVSTDGLRARIETNSHTGQWWFVFLDSNNETEATCEISITKEKK
jgi:hypothetical protein